MLKPQACLELRFTLVLEHCSSIESQTSGGLFKLNKAVSICTHMYTHVAEYPVNIHSTCVYESYEHVHVHACTFY